MPGKITSERQEKFLRGVAGGSIKAGGLSASEAKEILKEEGFSVDTGQGNLRIEQPFRINGRIQPDEDISWKLSREDQKDRISNNRLTS